MKEEVQWYLVEHLNHARASAVGDDVARWRASVLGSFGAKLEAFRYLDVVSDEEVSDWNRRMLEALGLTPPEPGPPGTAQIIWIGDGDPPPPEPSPSPSRLVRQVFGPDREVAVFGGRLRVLAVEIFDDHVTIRWRAAPRPDVRLAFPREVAAIERDVEGLQEWAAENLRSKGHMELTMRYFRTFDLADDAGTSYRFAGGGSGNVGGLNEMAGEARFRPTPPDIARRLVLHWLGATIDLPLD